MSAAFTTDEALIRPPNFHFEYRLKAGSLRVNAYDDENVMDIPLEWAFGAGDQAVTFVTRINEEYYLEHSFSYYAARNGLATTPGQTEVRPKNLPEAMGVAYKTLDAETGIVGCFECHSTGPVAADATGELRPSEQGVRCEVCHGPGSDHASSGNPQLIRNPRGMSATEQNAFCGTCHRPPGSPETTPDWDYAWNVRHQPMYLNQSACFRWSGGALSCLSCHDPHGGSKSVSTADYNAKCASCHEGIRHAATANVNENGNCVGCHMPQVSPQPYLRFTNHWIGIYGNGAKLRPER